MVQLKFFAKYLKSFSRGRILIRPFAFIFIIIGCTDQSASNRSPEEQKLYIQGKKVYMTVCVTCHNSDPKLDGSIGPANHGASIELLRAKVVKGEYPPGYKPKRDTELMPPFEEHANDIEALHVFLNQ